MAKYRFKLFENSINRMVITSFVFVLLVPIAFFMYSLFQNSWEQVEQRMLAKHNLVSSALVEPFTQFITTRQQSLNAISHSILNTKAISHPMLPAEVDAQMTQQRIENVLNKHLQAFGDFISLSFSAQQDGPLHCIATNEKHSVLPTKKDYEDVQFSPIENAQNTSAPKDYLSSVFKSNVSGEPALLLKQYVYNKSNQIEGTIYAEVSLKSIAAICENIRFGMKGHCVVVDDTGHVVAHPNQAWMDEIKDLSHISIVQKMLDGQSGTTEFYSPHLKENMVAGFNAIPKLGWGVMIPQPKSEITSAFDAVRLNTLVWLFLGVLLASIIAITLSKRINFPIKALIERTQIIAHSEDTTNLGPIPKNSPIEIIQLWESFAKLLSGLVKSHREVERLNKSLHDDIEKATEALRKKNKDLYELSILDHLTSLPNRRYFTSYLDQLLLNQEHKEVGVIFIDIDHFKEINDTNGHETGDAALVHLADILKDSVRKEDLVARLGGDEFIIYINEAHQHILKAIAKNILKTAHERPLHIHDKTITLSLSLGTVSHAANGQFLTEDFLRLADKAMYMSKTSGRNKVTHYALQKETLTR